MRALLGSSRMLANPRIATTHDAFKMRCDLYDFIPRFIFLFGHWEPNVGAVIRDALRPGDVFVDIGANIGYVSLVGASRVGASGAVVAIEAVPATFDRLMDNLRLNAATNVRAVQRAVSDQVGTLTLRQVSATNTGQATIHGTGLVLAEAAAAPLDEILTADELRRVRLIEIDIEGGEVPVLRRLLDTLPLYPADMQIIVEMAALDSDEAAAIFARFLALGFEAFAVGNDYTYEWYLGWRTTPPQPIVALPRKQTDVWFKRPTLT